MKAGMILVDKPVGVTSRHCVDHVVRCLGVKKVGHAGTLDPFAQGLLCVLWGRGTRLIPYLQEYPKTYRFEAEFGRVTDTQDRTGTTVATADASGLTAEDIAAGLESFRGDIEQVPPMYSALRVEGKRLYEHARQGVSVERKPRKRKVHALALLEYSHPVGVFEATVSSGTYVRTLAHDLGRDLKVGAVVTSLNRTAVGPHQLDRAVPLDSLNTAADVAAGGVPLQEALPDWKAVLLEDHEEMRRVVMGSWTDPEGRLPGEEPVRLVGPTGELLALARGGRKPSLLGVFAAPESVA